MERMETDTSDGITGVTRHETQQLNKTPLILASHVFQSETADTIRDTPHHRHITPQCHRSRATHMPKATRQPHRVDTIGVLCT